MQSKSKFYDNISAGTAAWIGAGSGVRGVGYNFAAAKSYGRAEVYIDRGEHDENKWIFNELFGQKEAMEVRVGNSLTWERLDSKRACRIKFETSGNIYDETFWPDMIEFMTDAMVQNEYNSPISKPSLKAKSSIYHKHFPEMEIRTKYTGFESFSDELEATVRKKLWLYSRGALSPFGYTIEDTLNKLDKNTMR